MEIPDRGLPPGGAGGYNAPMATYVARRVLYTVPVLVISTFLSFTFISLAGDPRANLLANPNYSVQTYHNLEHKYHLDRSIPVRYGYWVRDVFEHRLGRSLVTSQPLWPDIERTFGHTGQVIFFSESLALLLGIAIGIFSAVRQYSAFDYFFTSFSFLGFAMPTFWLALLLQILFVDVYLKWNVRIFYTSGLNTGGHGAWSLDRLQHIALPVIRNDGKPVTDGPFILTNYTRGQGVTLKTNPMWYGKKPKLAEIDFKIITDTNTEVQAMRGGEVDAINPTFGLNLLPLKSTPGLVFNQVPGLFQEHIDIQFGAKGQPRLKAPWLRKAIMMGIDRPAIIRTVYGEMAGNTKPLDSLVYYPAGASYKADFQRWNYAPAKALALLKAHCSGGPSAPSQSNSDIWTCSGLKASFRYTWTAGNATRTTQEAIVKAEMKSIGIEITDASLPANVVFGPTGIPSSNYDLANFAWVTTSDPAGFVSDWSCGGLQNYLNYCNRKATKLMQASDSELDPARRATLFQQANALMANDVPSIPLYARRTR
jgi:ABC-type transport system substrate-binding protein